MAPTSMFSFRLTITKCLSLTEAIPDSIVNCSDLICATMKIAKKMCIGATAENFKV
jgi:hypothetical protein